MDPSSSSSLVLHSSSSYKRKKDQDYYSCDDDDDESLCSSNRPKNDVFLSYSNEDVGKSFVSHLKGALKRSSFSISDHTMLPIGHDYETSELLKAIQDSEIYVVVLSPNYASSVKCLDELLLIMDSLIKFNKKRRVFPIFYHVDPSHVRSQQGSFLEAFHRHDSDIDPDRVQKWRHALQDLGQRSGQTMPNGVDEADILSRIVEELEKMQSPQDLHVTDHHVGLGSRAEELISKLRLDCEDVLVVAVFGISGIGKTAIVKATYNRIATDFDVSCFLADIHYYCGKHNWKVELQKELISSLTQNDKPPITRHNDGLTKIRKLVSRRKILLVLDDVDNFPQLEALGIDPSWFYNGSRIIVTTRDKKSLGNIPYVCYHTKLLNRRESLNLFTRLMFSRDDHVDNKFVEEIVGRAGGLPLVLEVWSRHFKCHERKQWPRILEKLRRIPHEDVQKKLQVSYDSLSPRAKNLFLDIACFFDGMEKDIVIKVLQDEESGFYVDFEIQDLIDKGLVKEEYNQLRMHAVIREMGREVVRQENEDDPGQRSRLVDPKDVVRVLRDCSGTDSVRSICWDWNDLNEDVTAVQVEALRKMSNLMFIQLVDSPQCYYSSNDEIIIMSPLCFKRLKYLKWSGFPFKCLDKFDMGNVVVIKLYGSKLEILWEEGAFKSLKKLRILDVRNSRYLTRTGSFNGLENLEELDLSWCENLEELDGSIGCLQKLVKLDLNGCYQLKRVPWEMIGKLTSLVTLNLSRCEQLKRVPWEMIGKLTSLVTLHLTLCPNILNISHELGNLKLLKSLYMNGNNFPSLPDSLCQLHQLSFLELHGCANLKSIPNLPPNIQHVRAPKCSSLVSLPDNLCQLHQLREIQLYGCANLKSIPNLPPNIERIEACRCSSLESLPDNLCQLHQLSHIYLEGCANLKSIPSLPPNIQFFETSGCSSLESLPDNLCQLHQLSEIALSGCANLKSIPNLPPNIQKVLARDCSSLESLPSNMSELQFLTELVLDNCKELGSEGFVKVTGLRNLLRLSMGNCNVSQVSSEIGNLASLRKLNLSGNPFPSLPDSISNLSRLEILEIRDCRQLELLPLLPSKLRKIEAGGCGSLDVMPFDSRKMGYVFRSQYFTSIVGGLTIELSGKEEDVIPGGP